MDPKPDLEPFPGPTCPTCREPLTFVGPDFCGACEEAGRPVTFDAFLSYAVGSTVNGGSGRWPR